MDMQKERKVFEAWFGNTICDLGCADNREFEIAWSAWQAAHQRFEKFIDQAICDSACAEERQTLQRLLEEFKGRN